MLKNVAKNESVQGCWQNNIPWKFNCEILYHSKKNCIFLINLSQIFFDNKPAHVPDQKHARNIIQFCFLLVLFCDFLLNIFSCHLIIIRKNNYCGIKKVNKIRNTKLYNKII